MPLRIPTSQEVEQIRLILSAYQDGSGMLVQKGGLTLPGWRDFERTIAIVFCGEAQESKAIFDVLVPASGGSSTKFGISCKMRRELNKLRKAGRVSLELSNSSGYFWTRLRLRGITPKNYLRKPSPVGRELLSLVKRWHDVVSIRKGGVVDLKKSFYFVLLWNKQGLYQLDQFSIHLPNPKSLKWYFPTPRCLKGDDGHGTVFEWYGESGGQLKYYPLAKDAVWCSKPFSLEPIKDLKGGILARVAAYFPTSWSQVKDCDSDK